MDESLSFDKTDNRDVDEAALSALYEEYFDKIAYYAYVRLGVRADAEDIAGEVFLRALKSLKLFKKRGVPIQAWLFRIAHNLVMDKFRKMRNQKIVSIEGMEIEGGANPATIAERNVEMERVKKAMEKLTQEQREVLGLRFFGGLTSREAAQVLNKTDGAVREMQRAAIERLRSLLADV